MNLIETIGRQLSPALVSKLGGALGESPTSAAKGASAAVPAILSGIVQKGSTEHGASDLLDSFKSYESTDASTLGSSLDDPGAKQSMLDEGKGLLSSLFGNREGALAEAIGSHSGMKKSSALGMLGMLAPMVMGTLGRHARDNRLDAPGLASLLRSQSGIVSKALPAGLSSVLGLGGATASSVTTRVVEPRHKKGRGLLWGALALGAVALGGFFLCARDRGEVSKVPEVQAPAIGGGPQVPETPELQAPEVQKPELQAPEVHKPDLQAPEVKAPELQAPEVKAPEAPQAAMPEGTGGGPAVSGAAGLEAYLKGTGSSDDPDFAMEGLTFEHASSHLSGEGAKAADSLADMLKANPNAKIRIEGHTDSTGNAETNRQLSDARARAVADHLYQEGIARDRVEAVGLGPDEPTASNDTEEGRRKNRRIDVVVLER